jgi:hypothetical protein
MLYIQSSQTETFPYATENYRSLITDRNKDAFALQAFFMLFQNETEIHSTDPERRDPARKIK